LAKNIAIGEADCQSVLVGVVLVLVLGDQLVALTVISLTLCNTKQSVVINGYEEREREENREEKEFGNKFYLCVYDTSLGSV